jgi:hypothetical protein
MKKLTINIPEDAKELVRTFANSYSFIAGGSVRSIYEGGIPADFDVFTASPETYPQLLQDIEGFGFQKLFQNPMLARYVTVNGQLLDAVTPRVAEFMCTQGTPEQVISHFDFTVARAAIISENQLLVDDDFEEDCQNKVLRIKHIVCPLSSVKRIAKYTAKKFTISNTEILKVFTEFQNRDMSRLTDLLGRRDLSPDEVSELMTTIYVD